MGDDALDELSDNAPHVAYNLLSRGGRIEQKPYDGGLRIYWVIRYERKCQTCGGRYRPTNYLGKTKDDPRTRRDVDTERRCDKCRKKAVDQPERATAV